MSVNRVFLLSDLKRGELSEIDGNYQDIKQHYVNFEYTGFEDKNIIGLLDAIYEHCEGHLNGRFTGYVRSFSGNNMLHKSQDEDGNAIIKCFCGETYILPPPIFINGDKILEDFLFRINQEFSRRWRTPDANLEQPVNIEQMDLLEQVRKKQQREKEKREQREREKRERLEKAEKELNDAESLYNDSISGLDL